MKLIYQLLILKSLLIISCTNAKVEYYDTGEIKTKISKIKGDTIFVEEYNKQGAITQSLYMVNEILEGDQITFYSNGSIKTKAKYKKGKINGLASIFNIDGSIDAKSYYKNGKLYYHSNSSGQKLISPLIEFIPDDSMKGLLKIKYSLPTMLNYEIDSMVISYKIEAFYKKEFLKEYKYDNLKFNNGELIKSLNVIDFDSIDIIGKVYPIGNIDTTLFLNFEYGNPIKIVKTIE
ncbi:hypothetical protein N9L92_01865 [Saprospiraceae bacterium]|nr:hypothetical protein [Saprospiraceae bacterium]